MDKPQLTGRQIRALERYISAGKLPPRRLFLTFIKCKKANTELLSKCKAGLKPENLHKLHPDDVAFIKEMVIKLSASAYEMAVYADEIYP